MYVLDYVNVSKLSFMSSFFCNTSYKKDPMILVVGGQLKSALEPDSPTSSLLGAIKQTHKIK